MSQLRIDRPSELRSSRRAALLRIALLGVTVPSLIEPTTLRADQPTPGTPRPASVRRNQQRIVRPVSDRTVRLKPVSRDFDQTIVRSIATDPRSELVAVAGDDHAIRILDSSSLQVMQTLSGHTDLIRNLHFDSSGHRLVSAGNDGQLILWDRDSGFNVLQKMQGTPALACVRFSPDGRELAAVGFGHTIYLIGQGKGSRQPQLECDCNDLRALAYRHDQAVLAVGGRNGEMTLFDCRTSESIGTYKVHRGRIHELIFADSSSVVVSVGDDGFVSLFDTEQQRTVRRIAVTGGKLFSVAILDQQHLAVAGSDNIIRVVNVSLGRVVEQLEGHTGSIASLESDGRVLFSGGYDATLRRWQLDGAAGNRERIAERDQKLGR